MHKGVIAVMFRPDAPIDGFIHLTQLSSMGQAGDVRYMDCDAVEETSFGFLRLIPKRENAGGVAMGIFVPPDYIMYMLQGAESPKVGF